MKTVEKRMRKYFSEADGTQSEVMDLGPQLKFDLLQTITAGRNIFKTSLPQKNYKSVSRLGQENEGQSRER